MWSPEASNQLHSVAPVPRPHTFIILIDPQCQQRATPGDQGGQSIGTAVHCYLCVYEYQKEKESCFMLRLAMRVDVVMTLCVAKTFYIWDCNYAITTRQSITILLLKL